MLCNKNQLLWKVVWESQETCTRDISPNRLIWYEERAVFYETVLSEDFVPDRGQEIQIYSRKVLLISINLLKNLGLLSKWLLGFVICVQQHRWKRSFWHLLKNSFSGIPWLLGKDFSKLILGLLGEDGIFICTQRLLLYFFQVYDCVHSSCKDFLVCAQL